MSAREQVPGSLARLDDPWGLTWRLVNALRRLGPGRLSPRREARFLAAWMRGARCRRPILILGAPRSGTSFLFQLLRASPELGSLPGEGHDLWRAYHHPRRRGWRGDAVGAGELGWGERRFVHARFRAWTGERRLVEKTPENALRIPYLLELFPDAHLVAIHRDPREVLRSMLDGWCHPGGRFRSYYLPERLEIPGYPHPRRWCFGLVEGWRELRRAPLPEVVFAQWRRHLEGLLAGRELVPAERWHELRLEEVLAQPEATCARLLEGLGVVRDPGFGERLASLLERPPNALAAPGGGARGWRRREAEVLPLIARAAPLARRIGYALDPATGELELIDPPAGGGD